MKPVIVYVDDEPNNLTIFESAVPDDWEVHVFDSPLAALARLEELKPWVVISDQRMPGMKGVEFLGLSLKIVPAAVRIVVTGYSDEDLIIESVRKAQVFDYIRKPWDFTDLITSLNRAIEYYRSQIERDALLVDLKAKTEQLTKANLDFEQSARREKEMLAELKCWVPPFLLWALNRKEVKFPLERRIVGITFDIIASSRIHGVEIHGRPLRARIIELFSEAVIRNGGWRESHAGDSAYGHFGLEDTESDLGNPVQAEAALSAAREFRVSLRSISQQIGMDVECGIALHIANDAVVNVHTVQLSTPRGVVTQKSFDTASSQIDLLHRMEKLVHQLPGSNIILSQEFVDALKTKPESLRGIGEVLLRGQKKPVSVSLIASDRVKNDDFEKFVLEVSETAGTEDRKVA